MEPRRTSSSATPARSRSARRTRRRGSTGTRNSISATQCDPSFDTEWFTPSPNRRFGEHPKRGILNLKTEAQKALQAAILEAKDAGRL
jgi:hypothetical protein